MLELRPSCEHCNKELSASSSEAMICSYECTFCQSCVDQILENVCPNCGGGFCKRPSRPSQNLKNGNCLENDPASITVIHKPVDTSSHVNFAEKIKKIDPYQR